MFVPMKSSHLCSKHISADVFEKACYSQRAALKSYAASTIFIECRGQVSPVIDLSTYLESV